MATLMESNRTYNFDFSGKRVKVNGEVQDKFSLVYFMKYIDYDKAVCSLFKQYNDNKQRLLSMLQKKQYSNVTIAL